MERRAGHDSNAQIEKQTGPKLPHYEAFIVTDKTTKEMKITIDRWNLMRQSLLDNDLMEQK